MRRVISWAIRIEALARHRPTIQWAGALVAIAFAVWLRQLLDPILGDHLALATLYGAVAASVWLGGYRVAIPAAALGYLACDWLFIYPRDAFDFSTSRALVGAVLYAISSSAIILFGEALRAALQRETTNANELAREIAERELAQERLRHANRRKDEFLAMLSHELRNPLAAMITAAYVLRVAEASAPSAVEARNIMDRQIRHMAKLIEDLLNIGRLSVGKVKLARETFDLGQAVNDVVAEWRGMGRFERHQVTLDTEQAWINGDRSRMEQVVFNLLENSLKFTPEHGSIRVGLRVEKTDAVITVADSGEGIASDDLGRVLDLFEQGDQDPARSRGGMGIGLALAKRVAELHGGKIEIASDGPGLGTIVTVRIPRCPEPAEQAAAALMPTSGALPRVLVVEDNSDTRQMLKSALALMGHEVSDAADGATGLAAATAIRPDVALIDLGLPDMDGYELARRMRAAMLNQRLLLIALTGYGQPEDRDRSREAGFDAHLTKPIAVEGLKHAIASLRGPV